LRQKVDQIENIICASLQILVQEPPDRDVVWLRHLPLKPIRGDGKLEKWFPMLKHDTEDPSIGNELLAFPELLRGDPPSKAV
jgi:hypothetical protein